MTDFHGIQTIEDNSRGNELAGGGVPTPPPGHVYVTVPDANNRAVFLTTEAPDGSRIRVIARKVA
ncbi:MAG TPA: hypothetical protein VF503_20300 [Sphingobium sp.]|uniref:hypothetical protein n=1 Tax=Sphingobium sp. TaxID=1912891 RepID=UPI002ED10D31